MAIIIPQSDLYLIKVPIEIDNRNQLTFTNATEQYNYFSGLNKHNNPEQGTFTYQRQDGTVRYPACIDDIREYNYCMYRNDGYSNKWFYAFITDMQYVSDKVTAITLKTDVWQTWQFNLNFKASFIEREHVNNDTVGLHTIPENLETGDYISTNLQPTTKGNFETCYCVAVTELLASISASYSTLNEKIPSGLQYIGLTSTTGVRDVVEIYNNAGKSDAIYSIFVIPKDLFTSFNNVTGIDGTVSTTVKFESSTDITITKTNYVGKEYYPRNRKLFCYPYNFLQVSNNNGTIVNYNWEDFNQLVSDNNYKFNLYGTMTEGGSFKLYPIDYKNILNNYDEGIALGKFPIGGWNTDPYINWLTQNGINLGFVKLNAVQAGYLGSALSIGAGVARVANGDITGGLQVGEGLGNIFNVMQTQYQHDMMPEQAKGSTNVGDASYQFGLTNFTFKRISIKNEYASIIDGYFDMFGYKVNALKVPNITGRSNWNFVKTIGCNIDAYIPQRDLQEIKDMFNNGITLWHKANKFLDYSESNTIV